MCLVVACTSYLLSRHYIFIFINMKQCTIFIKNKINNVLYLMNICLITAKVYGNRKNNVFKYTYFKLKNTFIDSVKK